MRDGFNAICLGVAVALIGAVGLSLPPARAETLVPLTLAQVRAECAPDAPPDEYIDQLIQSMLSNLSKMTDDQLRAALAEAERSESSNLVDLTICMVKRIQSLRSEGTSAAAGGNADEPASNAPGSKAKPKRLHVPEAIANDCLKPHPEGGVQNTCDFAIEYIYCVYKPKKDSWSSLFDCEQGKTGSWQVGPQSRAIMQNGGERLVYFGCRYGPTLSEPDGISPADFHFTTVENTTARCREWGATDRGK